MRVWGHGLWCVQARRRGRWRTRQATPTATPWRCWRATWPTCPRSACVLFSLHVGIRTCSCLRAASLPTARFLVVCEVGVTDGPEPGQPRALRLFLVRAEAGAFCNRSTTKSAKSFDFAELFCRTILQNYFWCKTCQSPRVQSNVSIHAGPLWNEHTCSKPYKAKST